MRLTGGATYVVGGRVGMGETHQVKIHFNWSNLFSSSSSFFYTYSLLVYSSSVGSAVGRSLASSPPVVFALKSRRFVRSCPKKVEKNVKRKHYFWKFGAPLSHLRLSRRIFLSFRFLPYVSFPLKTNDFLKILVQIYDLPWERQWFS